MDSPKERAMAYRKAFGGTNGENVLKDLSAACGFMKTGCHDSVCMNAYDKGRRDVFVYVKNLVDADLTRLEDAEAEEEREQE